MLNPVALEKGNLKKRIWFNIFEKYNLENADCLHALNEQEYNFVRKKVKNTPIAIIPIGINLPKLKEIKKKENEKIVFIYLGRLDPIKGLENLILAWKNDFLGNSLLILAGFSEGNYGKLLLSLVEENNLMDRVHFYGPVYGEEKEILYQQADCYILPSLSEGIPTTVLEAWSFRLPVLMTDACNLQQGFENNAAIRIEADPNSIAIGVRKIMDLSSEERLAMGKQGFNLVSKEFSWDVISNQYVNLYKWVLGQIEKPDFVK